MDRRDFLRCQLGAGLIIALPTPWERSWVRRAPRTLILIELNGGNDGLRTVVPYEDDAYYRARPSLAVPPTQVHRMNDHIGLAPELPGLSQLYQEGVLTIVQGVGMASPDRSHFVSIDRWHTGNLDPTTRSGWLARSVSATSSSGITALALGDRTQPRLLDGVPGTVLSCDRMTDWMPDRETEAALLADSLVEQDREAGTPEDRELARQAQDLLRTLDRVRRARERNDGIAENALGSRLADVLALVRSRLGMQVAFVRMNGFDTHASEDRVHPELMRGLDGALSPFVTALRQDRLLDDVLIVVYSEFGRRVAENGSRGTDHGSAGPVFLLGGGRTGGILGEHPSLLDLEDGDLRPSHDYRRVLATAAQHLGVRTPEAILGPAGLPL